MKKNWGKVELDKLILSAKGNLTANANCHLSFDINRTMTIFTDTDLPEGQVPPTAHKYEVGRDMFYIK